MSDTTDKDEFSAFCHAQYPRLVGTLSLYTGDRALSQDIAQETLAKVWRDWGTRRATSPTAYAHRAALNMAKNHFRHQGVRRRYAHIVGRQPSEPARSADTADAVAVREALARLEHEARAAVVLRYYADLSVADTAEAMGIPPNTVKTLTRRALQTLGEELSLDTEEDEPYVR